MARVNPLEQAFPGLIESGYRVTSPATDGYNCLSWAAGEDTRWWWPDPSGIGYWPEGIPRVETLEAFQAAYELLGFCPTDSPDPQVGFEKLAVYAHGVRPTHAARQLPNGRWTSKLGSGPDIGHAPDNLTGELYGTVALILQRPLPLVDQLDNT